MATDKQPGRGSRTQPPPLVAGAHRVSWTASCWSCGSDWPASWATRRRDWARGRSPWPCAAIAQAARSGSACPASAARAGPPRTGTAPWFCGRAASAGPIGRAIACSDRPRRSPHHRNFPALWPLLGFLPTTGHPPLSPTASRGTLHQQTLLPSARRGSFLSPNTPSNRSSGLSPLRDILPAPHPPHHSLLARDCAPKLPSRPPGTIALSPPPRRRRSPAPPAPQHFKRRADGAPVGPFKPNGRALLGDGRATQRDWLSGGEGRGAPRMRVCRAVLMGRGDPGQGAGRRRRDQAGA